MRRRLRSIGTFDTLRKTTKGICAGNVRGQSVGTPGKMSLRIGPFVISDRFREGIAFSVGEQRVRLAIPPSDVIRPTGRLSRPCPGEGVAISYV